MGRNKKKKNLIPKLFQTPQIGNLVFLGDNHHSSKKWNRGELESNEKEVKKATFFEWPRVYFSCQFMTNGILTYVVCCTISLQQWKKIRMLIRYMNNNQHILYSLLIASLYAIYDVPAIMICHRHTKNNNKWFGKSQSYFMYFSRSRSSYVTKNWKHFSWHILFSLYIEWGQRCFSHSKSKAQRPVFNHSET